MRTVAVLATLVVAALICSSSIAQERKTMMIADCDDATAWEGGEVVAEPRTQGDGALKWRLADEPLNVRTEQIPHDWSGFNTLAFDLYSEKATDAPLWVIMYSQNTEREGPDYFVIRLKLDFEGWRNYVIPYDAIGRARFPIGWHQIESVMLHSAWDPAIEVDPEAVVYLDNVRAVEYEETGPRMTDEELFEALDLERPELSEIRAAVEAGDLEAAKRAWAEHLRGREQPRWFKTWQERPEPDPEANTVSADRSMNHIFRWQGKDFFLGEDIDWSQNQMTEGESATVEWNASLNRHGMINYLADAYWRTGEDRYAEKAVELMLDWIEDAPVLLYSSGNSPYHWAWETLNTAVRASGSWPDIIFRTLDSPAWTDEAIATVTKSMAEHARHLMKHPTRNNWLTAESTGLYYIGVLFPEFDEAQTWRETAIERLYEQMDEEVYPDGLEYELALGYNLWVLRNYANVLDFAVLNNRRDELPRDWLDRIESMFDYVLYASMPDGTVPGLNDSGNADRGRYMEMAARYFPEREDFRWAAEGEGDPPDRLSRAFDYSGHYVMRTGWTPDASFLLFDAGTFGSGHQHEDKLTFVMYALGRMHVVDAGNYMYDDSRWRRYVLSTRGHNTVRVDGLDQHRRGLRETYTLDYPFQPLGTPWATGEDFDFVRGSYDSGYGDDNSVRVEHTRNILFVRPDYWIIADRLAAEDAREHQYEALFHLNADEAEIRRDGSVLSITPPGESRLLLTPLGTDSVEVVKGREEEPVQGWSWAAPGGDGAIPTAVYRLSGARDQRAAWIMRPVRADEEAPVEVLERIDTDGDGIAGQLTLPDGTRHLFAFTDGRGETEFGGFLTDADVAFVEILPDGAIGRTFMHGGHTLRPAR